jgi:hypothetical protein
VAGGADRGLGAPRRGLGLGVARRGMGLGGQPLASDGNPLAQPGSAGRDIGGLVLFLPCCLSFLFTHGCSIRAW